MFCNSKQLSIAHKTNKQNLSTFIYIKQSFMYNHVKC